MFSYNVRLVRKVIKLEVRARVWTQEPLFETQYVIPLGQHRLFNFEKHTYQNNIFWKCVYKSAYSINKVGSGK